MKRTLWIIAGCVFTLGLGVYLISRSANPERSQTTNALVNSTATVDQTSTSPSKSSALSTPAIRAGSGGDSVKTMITTEYNRLKGFDADALTSEDLKLKKEVEIAENRILDLLKKHGIDGKKLNAQFDPRDEEAFYETLPTDVADGYRVLHGKLHALQAVALKMDGKTPEFLDRSPRDEMPDDVAEHALFLEKQSLSPAVFEFVTRKSGETSIEDADITTVARLCQQQWICIEKSAYVWIKANHVLSEDQLKVIAQYRK